MEGNLGEGTNIRQQGEGFTANMPVSRKKEKGPGLGWDLVGLGDYRVKLVVSPSPGLLCESGLPLSQGLRWGFPLTIQGKLNQEIR